MKITKEDLQQIIKEELTVVLEEDILQEDTSADELIKHYKALSWHDWHNTMINLLKSLEGADQSNVKSAIDAVIRMGNVHYGLTQDLKDILKNLK